MLAASRPTTKLLFARMIALCWLRPVFLGFHRARKAAALETIDAFRGRTEATGWATDE